MGDTLVLDIQTNLLKTMQGLNDTLTNTNDLLVKNQKNFKEIDKQTDKIVDHYNDIEKRQRSINSLTEKFGKILKGVLSVLGSIAGPLLGIFSVAGITDAVKGVLNYQQAFLDLSYTMGQSGKTYGAYVGAMHNIVQTTGIAQEKAEMLVVSLAKFRVSTKDIATLGNTTAMFSEITGVGADNAARLAGELSRTGKVGAKGIQNVMFSMVQVQRSVGMTNEEMEQLSDEIITDTKLLHQMGKTDAEIAKFAKGTAQLAGAFTKVGLTIQDTQDMLDRFLDPTKIEDNALLYAQLGYSMSDVINGEIPDPNELNGKLKGLADQVKGMGMAGVEMAKQLGIPYQQLMQMRDLEKDNTAGKDVADVNKQMAGMQESQEGIQKNLEHSANRIADSVQQVADLLVPALTKFTDVIEKFVSKITSNLKNVLMVVLVVGLGILLVKVISMFVSKMRRASVDTSEDLQKGVLGAMKMGSQKGADLMKKNMAVASRAISEDYKQRVMESSGYASRQAKADYFNILSQLTQLGGSKNMMKGTAAWLEQISMGSKATSVWTKWTEENNKKIAERLSLTKRDNDLVQSAKKARIDELKERQSILETRKAELAKVEQLTGRQREELNLIEKELGKNYKTEQKYANDLEKTKERNNKSLINQYKQMNGAQLDALLEESQQRKKAANEAVKASAKRLEGIQLEQEALEKASTGVNDELEALRKKDKLTSEDSRRMMELVDLQKKMVIETNKLKNEQEDITIEKEEQMKEFRKEIELQKTLNEASEGKSKAGKGEIKTGGLYKVADYFKSTFNNVGSSLGKVGDKIKNSMNNVVEAAKERLDPKNWLASIRASITEGKAGDKKLLAAIGGLGIGMAILRPILQKFQPTIDVLQEILMDKVLPIVAKVAKALLPAVIVLINTLLPPLLWVLGTLVIILGKVLSAITTATTFLATLGPRIKKAIFGGTDDEIKAAEDSFKSSGFGKVLAGIDSFGATLEDTGKQLQGFMGKKLIDEEAQAKLMGSLDALITKPQGSGGATTDGTPQPATYAATGQGVRQVSAAQAGAPQAQTAASTSQTAANTAALAQGQAVQIDAQNDTNTLLKELTASIRTLTVAMASSRTGR